MIKASKRILLLIMPVILFLSSIGSISAEAALGGTVIPDDAAEFESHYYKIYNDLSGFDKASFEKAQKLCEKRGGHLAVITSEQEDAFLKRLCDDKGYSDVFFGLSYSGDKWKWVNGEKLSYTNWAQDKPNGKKAETYGQYSSLYSDGKWNNGIFSQDGIAYICEWDEGTLISDATVEDALKSVEKGKSKRFGDSYYRVFDIPLDRGDAAMLCLNMGGHLVYINDEDEQEFVTGLIKKGSSNMYWTGAVLDENGWGWQNGDMMDRYNNWTSKKPNNNSSDAQFAVINKSLKKYDKNHWVAEPQTGSPDKEDENCINYGFICEWEIVCISDDGEFIAHEDGEWQIEKDNTCTEQGSRVRYCKRCGKVSQSEITKPTEHEFVKKGLSFPGYTQLVCVKCGTHASEINKRLIWILPCIVIVYCLIAAAYIKARSDFEKYSKNKNIEIKTRRIPWWAFAVPPAVLAAIALIVWFVA
ncbi:MAG: C-type lectin domain-containing protein [Ruminococcus sp.]|nr:C-type lectin domain-containing protein [Ruminococcus sp.]